MTVKASAPRLGAGHGLSRRTVFGLLAPVLLGLQGCEWTSSPSLPFYGAYFPFWLVCAALGVVGSVLVRMLLIRLGVDEGMPFRTLVYIALACLIAFSIAATAFGR